MHRITKLILENGMLASAAIFLIYTVATHTGNNYISTNAENIGMTNLALGAMLAYLGLWFSIQIENKLDSNTKN